MVILSSPHAPIAPIGEAPDAAERARRIAAAVPRSHQFVPLPGGYRELPVVEIAEGDLLYRAANGRIVAELLAHLRQQGGSLAALVADEASAATQQLLHGLLVAKAADAAGPVMRELARHGKQTEPLLVTADGVLVNGNRRLAAMRELHAGDPDRYAGFAQVTAAVLPADIAAPDVEFLEAALQMAPEIKLAYGWINRRLKLRHQRQELGLPDAAIADAYRMETVEQVGAEITQLALAEAYLAAFRDELDYPAVADAEALFVGLAAQLATLPDHLRPLWQAAGLAMIEARGTMPSPIQPFFPFADAVPPTMPVWAMRRLGEEIGLVPMTDDQRASPRKAELPADAIEPLVRHFTDRAAAATQARSLTGLLEQLRAEYGEEKAPLIALKSVSRARIALGSVEAGRMTQKQLRELRSEMIALEATVATLLGDTPAVPETAQPGIIKRLITGR